MSPPSSAPTPRACCENGRPVMTDPHTGQTICSCQYGSALLNSYQRLPGLASNLLGATPYSGTGTQGYVGLGSEGSAFYSPLVSSILFSTPALSLRCVKPNVYDHASPYTFLRCGISHRMEPCPLRSLQAPDASWLWNFTWPTTLGEPYCDVRAACCLLAISLESSTCYEASVTTLLSLMSISRGSYRVREVKICMMKSVDLWVAIKTFSSQCEM